MKRLTTAALCIFGLSIPIMAQTRQAMPTPTTTPGPPYQHPVMATGPYQRNWYDAMLRQFNPDNLNWGQWIEQRREELLAESVASPYFKYSLVATALLLLLAMALAKALIDKSRMKWLAQERYEDLLRQDTISRREAHAAIRRYNDHIEKCNRVVEAEIVGRQPLTSQASGIPGDLHQAFTELAEFKREHGNLVARLEKKDEMYGELSSRLDRMAAKGSAPVSNGSASSGPSQGDLIKQVNDLREQLYHERERNKSLKGL